MQKDSARRRFPLADRVLEVIDDTLTGEVLLDEALKMMKSSEKMSVSSWIDLMSGGLYLFDHWVWDRQVTTTWLNADRGGNIIYRRDMESDENWISTETGTRTTGKGIGR